MYVLVIFFNLKIFDFFWYISLRDDCFCCVNYYIDVELRLCKCKDCDVFIYLLLEIYLNMNCIYIVDY